MQTNGTIRDLVIFTYCITDHSYTKITVLASVEQLYTSNNCQLQTTVTVACNWHAEL